MTYIHERSTWPGFTWDDQSFAAELAEVRHQQGRLLGRLEALGFDLRNEANLVVMTSEVVKSSAIEGERLEPDEVRSSIARRLRLDTAELPTLSRDVEGVVEMMLDATGSHESPLTSERLFGWHTALFAGSRSSSGPITVGAWRRSEAGPMQVVSGPMGKETVHFEAPNAGRLPAEMSRFVAWFDEPTSIDPVLHAAVAHLWFVTIHPFDDGNGRIARAIAEMALARADGSAARFYSMSTQILIERAEYYRQLEQAQRGGLDITPWLQWFLGCLDRAIEGSEQLLASVIRKSRFWQVANRHPLNPRQQLVVDRMLGEFEGHLSTSKYAKLAKCSPDTAQRDVRELLAQGILVQNPGGGRSTSYRLSDSPLPEGP